MGELLCCPQKTKSLHPARLRPWLPPGCKSRAEMLQVSAKMLPPGGSCRQSALRNRLVTEEECGRQPYDYEKSEDLLLNFDFGEGLFVCTDFEITARIPLPALRATLPPGEGMVGSQVLPPSCLSAQKKPLKTVKCVNCSATAFMVSC